MNDRQEALEQLYQQAAERIAATQPEIFTDDEGGRWLVPVELVEQVRIYDRGITEAERAGDNAGRIWAATEAQIDALERLNIGTVEMWQNESDPFDLLRYMQQQNVPPELALAFQRGFFAGALTAWLEIKPTVLVLSGSRGT